VTEQSFISKDADTKPLRAELNKFSKDAQKAWEDLSELLNKIETLSASARFKIGNAQQLLADIGRCCASLGEGINGAKKEVKGTRGRSIDSIRERFLIDVVNFYEELTGTTIRARGRYTDHQRKSKSVCFLLAATEPLPGFEMTPEGTEMATDRALKRRQK